jgi:hypothetical protein
MVNEGLTALILAPVGIVQGNFMDEVDDEDKGHLGHGEDRERHDRPNSTARLSIAPPD